jgi:hypothetical protein
MTTGIALTLLTIAIFLDPSIAFLAYLGCVICTGIVVASAVVNSLTTWPGFVHPDDRLWSNILAYLLTLFSILTLGRFLKDDIRADWWFTLLFNIGTMLLLALILVLVLVSLSDRIRPKSSGRGAKAKDRSKETASRLILFALLVGAIMAGCQTGLILLWDYFYTLTAIQSLSYYYISVTIGSITTLILFGLGIALRSKYEAVRT